MKVVKISELTVLGAPIRKKLIDYGLVTLDELAALHTSPKQCFEVSNATGIAIEKLYWVINIALFSHINGVGVKHSLMLIKIGIDSTEKLSRGNPDKILNDMELYNQTQKLLTLLPSRLVVESWVKSAKALLDDKALENAKLDMRNRA